jgi:hypothetical protein
LIPTAIDHDLARDEIGGTATRLKDCSVKPVKLFANPNCNLAANYAGKHISMVKDFNFAHAVCLCDNACAA